ncbi:uncharacterized protein F5147DRAFT_658245 [Suillus discolor]|uniref:DUF6532 domain-containing protein n=1 Tax=Suillus discolor TaxID=1912936 RepID=A0A9P7EUZ4_9AGAM|nr:uncharacterized protein F5147DRAFT_658245 [Suillus discolor]KAG2090112.1 hypothetical protein F5147DRAFT_658245 [Suillus discolor]
MNRVSQKIGKKPHHKQQPISPEFLATPVETGHSWLQVGCFECMSHDPEVTGVVECCTLSGARTIFNSSELKFFGRVTDLDRCVELASLSDGVAALFLMAPITLYGGNGAASFKGSRYHSSQAAQFLAMIPPLSHQWQLGHSVDEQFENPESTTNSGGSPEMTLGDLDSEEDYSITESTYFDTSTMQALDNSDWQQLQWWTSLMESPLPQEADQDDDFSSMALAHPNYAHFYRETGQSQPTSYSQASQSGGFDWDAEIAATESYYNQTGFVDTPVAATSGGHLAHDSEMPQASGSSQRDGREMNSHLSTTRFDPPLRSNRYMPYSIPSRSLRPRASPIHDQGDMNEGSSYSLMSTTPIPTAITLPQLVTVIPQILLPPVAPQVLPPPVVPPVAPPAPTDIIFGPEVLSQVQSRSWELMKTQVVQDSFLMLSSTSITLARQSLDQTVSSYNHSDITEWSRGVAAQAHVVKMSNTVKNLRDSIKSIVWIHVISAYALLNALTLQTQTEIGIIIQNLLQHNNFLYGNINVGGQLVRVPFGHPTVRDFIRHLLFHDPNYQRYTSGPTRNI